MGKRFSAYESQLAHYLHTQAGYSCLAVGRLLGRDDKAVKAAIERVEQGQVSSDGDVQQIAALLDLPKLKKTQDLKKFDEFLAWLQYGRDQGFVELLLAFLEKQK